MVLGHNYAFPVWESNQGRIKLDQTTIKQFSSEQYLQVYGTHTDWVSTVIMYLHKVYLQS